MSPEAAPLHTLTMEKKKILVVDDERLIRWSIGQKLVAWGYSPIEAEDGAAAVNALNRESPDLVLLDMRLPDRHGIDLLRDIRTADTSLPVIMMTAYGTLEDALAAMRSGACRFFTKPVNLDELHVAVENALEMRANGSSRFKV